jgi:hypothetical protein
MGIDVIGAKSRSQPTARRLNQVSFEMILVMALISLHDFMLSDALSLPGALQRSTVGELRAFDKIASGLEFVVPLAMFGILIVLWLIGRNAWVRPMVFVFLGWVTLRLTTKVGLLLLAIVSGSPRSASPLLTDTVVMLFANILLFGAWYWMIDGGGPRARAEGATERFDFAFPQRMSPFPGWADWKPSFWDYLYIGFCASTQFGSADTSVLSVRAKLLLMLQVTLAILVIVFIASVAIGVIR